jgi:hypothetical protein
MPVTLGDLVRGGLVPAAVALGVFLAWRLAGRRGHADRYAAAHAVSAGFLVACLLFDWVKVPPAESWQWLPWLGLAAATVGPATAGSGTGWVDRLALRLALGAVAAWALVPTWPALAETRGLDLAAVALGIVVLCVALEGLPERFPGATFPWLLCGCAVAAAGVLALSYSLKFAQLAGAVAAALGGAAVAALFQRNAPAFRGGSDVFAVLIGGLVYTGWLYSSSEVPVVCYVLPAVAPLGVWLCAAGPVARRSPVVNLAARLAIIGIPLAVAIVWAMFAEPLDLEAL